MNVNNTVQLHGHLGKDPEVKTLDSGMSIANVNVATKRNAKVDGEWSSVSDWHRILFFGKKAEAVGKHFKKGSEIIVQGFLQTRSWDKDGETRYTTEVVCNDFSFCGGKNANDANSAEVPNFANADGAVVPKVAASDDFVF